MNFTRSAFPGQFRPNDSFMHRLDVRPKMIFVLLIMFLSFLSDSILFYLSTLALITGLQIWSGMKFRQFLAVLRPMSIGVLITLVFHLFFGVKSGQVFFNIMGIDLFYSGLTDGLYYSLRLLLYVITMVFLTSTTSPSQLAEGVSYVFKPLRRIGVRVNDIALIIYLAIRFIPILVEEYTTIRNAQLMRGVRFDGSLSKRITKNVSLMLPIFLTSLTRADELALAIEVRGYHSRRLRTVFSHTKFGWSDIRFMAASSIAALLLFWMLGKSSG